MSTDTDERTLEASEWLMRLHEPTADEQTTAQWLQWCEADRENLVAFNRVRELWGRFDDPRLSGALALEHSSTESVSSSSPVIAVLPRLVRPAWAIAASIVLAVSAVLWLKPRFGVQPEFVESIATATGKLRREVLPDGSTVELGAGSSVRVRMNQERREFFIDDGEAFFDVAKDPHRPFMVQAGDLQVLAIGTAFNVRKAEDRVVVTVKEGAVRVAPSMVSTLSAEGQVHAGAGDQVTYSKSQRAFTMTSYDAVAKSSSDWHVGRLEYANEPLGSVIADVNRYSVRPISVADESLNGLIYTGTVRSDAVSDWLQGLEEVFPLTVREQGAQGVVLLPRER